MNIRGDYRTVEAAAVTTSATTTARIDKRGFASGSVINESGGAVVITWYGAATYAGTPLAVKDEDGTALTTTVGDDECVEIRNALAGVAYVLPVGDGAAALTFHFER